MGFFGKACIGSGRVAGRVWKGMKNAYEGRIAELLTARPLASPKPQSDSRTCLKLPDQKSRRI